jgi:UDP:flavonoid glycosyltransferase YjiC (YdhE family)
MSSILFTTFDGGGNVPPTLAVAKELQIRGHHVRVLGHSCQETVVTGAGLPFKSYPTARDFRGADNNSPFAWLAMFGDRAMGRDVLAELEERPADLVVVDCLTFGAIEAVADRGAPFVLLEHTFDEYFANMWLRGPIGIGLRTKRFHVNRLVAAARARVVMSLRELDPVIDPPSSVVHAGPVAPGVVAAPSEPTVLASLSTIRFRGMEAALQNIVNALGSLPVRGIVTTGPAVDPASLSVPASVEVHQYVPHTDLMPQTSVVIGHGGHATTMSALAHSLPLVVMPLDPVLDHKMVGTAVEHAGAGRLLTKKAKPEVIAAAVEELLADGPRRRSAARLGEAIRARAGASAGADAMESILEVAAGR